MDKVWIEGGHPSAHVLLQISTHIHKKLQSMLVSQHQLRWKLDPHEQQKWSLERVNTTEYNLEDKRNQRAEVEKKIPRDGHQG